MNITSLKEFLNAQNFSDQYPNVVGWCISTKEVDLIDTDEICVKFFVTKKKSIEELLPEEILPLTITLDGTDVITDVLETGTISTLDSYNNVENLSGELPIYVPHQVEDIKIQATTYFNTMDPLVIPLSISRNIHRPLKSGVSSIHTLGSDATLGLIVKDNTDNSICCLSNNHVYAQSQMSGYLSVSGTNLNTAILSARQPASSQYTPYGAISIWPQHTIGRHKRCQTFNLDNNYIDAALVHIQNYNIIDTSSNQVIGFNVPGPYQFATTQEIDSLLDPNSPNFQSPVFRSGRTLGPMGFPGNIYTKDTHAVPIDLITNQTQLSSIFTKVKHYKTYYGTTLFGFSGTDVYHCGHGSFNLLFFGNINIVPGGSRLEFGLLPMKFKDVWLDNTFFVGLGVDNKLYSSGTSTRYQYNYSDRYSVLPNQLPNYDNIDLKIYSGNIYILKDKKINVIGNNSTSQTIGYGLSADSTTTWVELPGEWDQIALFNYSLVALSGNKIFYSIPSYYNYASFSSFPVTNTPYSLNSNILNVGNFKKILDCNLLSSRLFALSTNDVLCEIFSSSSQGTSIIFYPSFKGNIKAVNDGYNSVTGILSGGEIYVKKNTDSNSNYNVTYSTNPLTAIQAQANSNTFTKIPGITADDVYGVFSSSNSNKETLLFNSNSSFSVLGYNVDGCFGINNRTNDKIIIDSIGASSLVNVYTNTKPLLFKDCITLRSKEKAFPVTQGGDSGTAVFALLSSTIPSLSTWKCVGLIFAGRTPTNDASGFICRIDRIVDSLNISPWSGTIPSHIPVIKNISVETQTETPHTITLSGRQFYNIGLNTIALSTAPTTTTSTTTTTTQSNTPTTTTSTTTTTTQSNTPQYLEFNSPLQFTSRRDIIPGNTTHTFPACATNITVNGIDYYLYRVWQLIICNDVAVDILPLNTRTPSLSDGCHVMAFYNSGLTNSFALTSRTYYPAPNVYSTPISNRVPIEEIYFNQSLSVVYPPNPTSRLDGINYYSSRVFSYYSRDITVNELEIVEVENKLQQVLIDTYNEANNWNSNV
jgi:hypothetical protein